MDSYLYVARIAYSTSVDGVGLRNALYVSGCDIQCHGCHNKELWDMKSGTKMTVEDVCERLNIDDFNISILGGEPLMQYQAILELCKLIKSKYPHKTIWMWTGYTYEHVCREYPEILKYLDVLVDGPYIEKYSSPLLRWRGSKNQRIIELKHNH